METLYKVDSLKWEVRQVKGGDWPAPDEEGDVCFDNTHFKSMGEALSKLKAEAQANLSLAAKDVVRLRTDLGKAEKALIEAALIHSAFLNEA
jgi:cell fate regulator YaaT (PSP1 superfamily)